MEQRNESTNANKKLSTTAILLCLLVPPVGLTIIARNWKTIDSNIRTGGIVLGTFGMIVCPCFGWFFFQFALGSLDDSSWDREEKRKEAAELVVHNRFLPQYQEQMAEGKTAFGTAKYDVAGNHFFEAEQITLKLESDSDDAALGAYIYYDWAERRAVAIAGRAAAALAQGDRSGASALAAKALELDENVSLPVQSTMAESLLQSRQGVLAQAKEQERQERIPDDFHRAVDRYMDKLDGYTVTVEGTRLTFSDPELVKATPAKDINGKWFGTMAWSVYIESSGSEWTSQRYYFIATLNYDYRWEMGLKRIQFGESLYELDDEMENLIPKM